MHDEASTLMVAHLDAAQVDEAADLLTRAFFASPIWPWLVPDETQRRAAMAWFMSASVRYGILGGEAYGAGAPLRGVAIWDRPSDGIDLDPDGTKSGFHEISSRMGEYVMARFAAMAVAQRVREQARAGGRTGTCGGSRPTRHRSGPAPGRRCSPPCSRGSMRRACRAAQRRRTK